jgi:phosphoserine phosphatase RsbU/P
MAADLEGALYHQLMERRRRLESLRPSGNRSTHLLHLIEEVDAALERMDEGSFGICRVCNEPIEEDLLTADPLVRACLDHLTPERRQALERDLDLASAIQNHLLPKRDIRWGGWEAAFAYEPLGSVSGDYCDLLPPRTPDGDFLFLLGDVSGKGIAASMLMAHLNATVRSLAAEDMPPSRLVAQVNRLFCESTMDSHYATLVCGLAGPEGTIELSNAGHCRPLIVSDGRVEALKDAGMPVGFFCTMDYPSIRRELKVGESLVLFSDGLTDTENPAGEHYGEERLKAFLGSHSGLAPRDFLAACSRDVEGFRNGAARTDDLSMMVLTRIPQQ